jgi:arylsulfatase A-like enzyme
MKKTIAFALLAIPFYLFSQEKPNFLWITCEDISPYLGSYGCQEALTPNLDKLASEGFRYTHAYANAPVCAVARSTLLTGMYSPTLGTHQMRSRVLLPESIPAYPQIFKKAGYYCTNNYKEDYNSNLQNNPDVWDESSKSAHYRNRKEGQPFFAVFNFLYSHESRIDRNQIKNFIDEGLIPEKSRINPEDIVLPPYHPDLPEIREDWARLHDLITMMDSWAGELLKELEEEGLADNTIVFFYSDHGGNLARSKRYLYNVGTQVPLIIRIPDKWKHLRPSLTGTTVDRMVSFVDFPKTVISMAGIEVPEKMQGSIFLGPQTEPPSECVFFSRDRMSDRYDFSRAVTDGKYYFIRNFMPHRPRGRDIRYGFNVQANWREWEKHFENGKCDVIQSRFFQTKPSVELFNTEEDPWHIDNLADEPEYQKHLEYLSEKLDSFMIINRDLGLIPEPMFYDFVGIDKKYKSLYDLGRSDEFSPDKTMKAAKKASLGDLSYSKTYLSYLKNNDPIIRYYGAYGLFFSASKGREIQKKLNKMMDADPIPANRLMAAQALCTCGDREAGFAGIMKEARATKRPYVFLMALNAFQYGRVDSFLSLEDLNYLHTKELIPEPGTDTTGIQLCRILTEDAISLWPNRRKVYE